MFLAQHEGFEIYLCHLEIYVYHNIHILVLLTVKNLHTRICAIRKTSRNNAVLLTYFRRGSSLPAPTHKTQQICCSWNLVESPTNWNAFLSLTC